MKRRLSCILLVDDDEPTNYLNKMVVDELNIARHVQVVTNGQEALDYLTGAGPRPDLILLNINMPLMDGWEFVDQYKRLGASQKANALVMLTTSLNPNDEKSALAHTEISGFLNKPLHKENLEQIIDQLFP
jgi:Response regulator containing a CheY-like receiver domain and a GGDEF domain